MRRTKDKLLRCYKEKKTYQETASELNLTEISVKLIFDEFNEQYGNNESCVW